MSTNNNSENAEGTTLDESSYESIDSQDTEAVIKSITKEILRRVIPSTGQIPSTSDRLLNTTDHLQTPSALLVSQEILGDILSATDYNATLKEVADAKLHAHNQYPLFNLKNIISKFHISDTIYDQLTFRESLLVSKLEIAMNQDEMLYYYIPQPVGGICIDVQEVEGRQPVERLLEEYERKLLKVLDKEGITDHIEGGDILPGETAALEDDLEKQNEYGQKKFLVHLSSQFDCNGNNGGSSMTSWVDTNMHTIEELRKEFIVEGENVNEQSLYTALKHQWYYVKHTNSLESIDSRKLYSLRKAQDYLSEGASFILMRYLAIKKYIGKFQLSCCYINGDLCINTYQCFGPSTELFQGKQVDCVRILRTIFEECGIVHNSITVLSFQGRILKHEWDDSDFVLVINPQVRLTDTKPTCLDELNLDGTWVDDMQLLSTYLDNKHKCLLELKSYDLDHPELRQLIADYVTQILLIRPSDIRKFTFKFFGNFISTQLPRSDYYE